MDNTSNHFRFYQAWAKSRPPASTISVDTFISDSMLAHINGELIKSYERVVAMALARKLRQSGQRPASVKVGVRHSPDAPGEVVFVSVEPATQAAVEDYAIALEQAAVSAYAALMLPWWKLAWKRWRRELPDYPKDVFGAK